MLNQVSSIVEDTQCSPDSDSTTCESPIINVRRNAARQIAAEISGAPENQSGPIAALSQVDINSAMFSEFGHGCENLAELTTPQLRITSPPTNIDKLRRIPSTALSSSILRKHLTFADVKSICSTLDAKKTAVLNKSGLCDMLYDTIRHYGSMAAFIEHLQGDSHGCTEGKIDRKRKRLHDCSLDDTEPEPVRSERIVAGADTSVLMSRGLAHHWQPVDGGGGGETLLSHTPLSTYVCLHCLMPVNILSRYALEARSVIIGGGAGESRLRGPPRHVGPRSLRLAMRCDAW